MWGHYRSSMPKRRNTRENMPNSNAGRMMHAPSGCQNPSLDSSEGKSKNFCKVGITYQNVYLAWLAIYCFSCWTTSRLLLAIGHCGLLLSVLHWLRCAAWGHFCWEVWLANGSRRGWKICCENNTGWEVRSNRLDFDQQTMWNTTSG